MRILLVLPLIFTLSGLAKTSAHEPAFRLLDTSVFSDGTQSSKMLGDLNLDFYAPDFQLTAEKIQSIRSEAQLEQARLKKELDRLDIHVSAEVALDDDWIALQKGLQWDSFRVTADGSHWLNQSVRELEKKNLPIDIYLDPAFLQIQQANGMTLPHDRRGRIAIFLYTDTIYNRTTDSHQLKTSFIDGHEWTHVLRELNRRGILSYHPKAPTNIVLTDHSETVPDAADYGRQFYFEEMEAYAQQAALTANVSYVFPSSKKYFMNLSKKAIDITTNLLKNFDHLAANLEKKNGQLFLKLGDETNQEVAFYLPSSVGSDLPEALKFAKKELTQAQQLAKFNLQMTTKAPPTAWRRNQLQFIDQLP